MISLHLCFWSDIRNRHSTNLSSLSPASMERTSSSPLRSISLSTPSAISALLSATPRPTRRRRRSRRRCYPSGWATLRPSQSPTLTSTASSSVIRSRGLTLLCTCGSSCQSRECPLSLSLSLVCVWFIVLLSPLLMLIIRTHAVTMHSITSTTRLRPASWQTTPLSPLSTRTSLSALALPSGSRAVLSPPGNQSANDVTTYLFAVCVDTHTHTRTETQNFSSDMQ